MSLPFTSSLNTVPLSLGFLPFALLRHFGVRVSYRAFPLGGSERAVKDHSSSLTRGSRFLPLPPPGAFP
eukprot:scaffold291424_cov26-Tisochrysis_lutea.AAC.1